MREGKKIIPVLRKGDALPAYLKSSRRVDMRSDDLFEKGITEIAETVLGESRRPLLDKK
jgi:hypothetical protein